MANELKTFTTGIADAIRASEGGGDTTKINPQDFASRIRKLPQKWYLTIANGDSFKLCDANTPCSFVFPLVNTPDTAGGLTIQMGKKEHTYQVSTNDRFCLIIGYDGSGFLYAGCMAWGDGTNTNYGLTQCYLSGDNGDVILKYKGSSSNDLELEGYNVEGSMYLYS